MGGGQTKHLKHYLIERIRIHERIIRCDGIQSVLNFADVAYRQA